MNAFSRLKFSRPTGFGVGHIPFSEITSYFATFPPVIYELQDSIYLLQEMDCEFVDYHRSKSK